MQLATRNVELIGVFAWMSQVDCGPTIGVISPLHELQSLLSPLREKEHVGCLSYDVRRDLVASLAATESHITWVSRFCSDCIFSQRSVLSSCCLSSCLKPLAEPGLTGTMVVTSTFQAYWQVGVFAIFGAAVASVSLHAPNLCALLTCIDLCVCGLPPILPSTCTLSRSVLGQVHMSLLWLSCMER